MRENSVGDSTGASEAERITAWGCVDARQLLLLFGGANHSQKLREEL